jgi:hypothetical protein
MIPTFTFFKRRYGEFSYLIFIVLLPFAAHSQNTTDDNNAALEYKMRLLYDQAHQLYADLPTRDFRGSYLTFSFGISPFGHIKTWDIENVCDCEGNVVETKTVASFKAPIAFGIGFEKRLTNAFSLRFVGNYAALSHSRGKNAIASNGAYAQMLDNYALTQFGLQSSALLYVKKFYVGAGYSYAYSKASGFKTDAPVYETKPPQYYNLKADVLKSQQRDNAPHMFVGYRHVLSPLVSGSFELGVGQKFYANAQLTFTLSPKTRASLTHWEKEFAYYKRVRREAIAIDMVLHPAKFQSNDCTILDTSPSSSNSCPR